MTLTDTGPLVALIDKGDDYHEACQAQPESKKRYNVMDFYGVGREAWVGVDVQQYINEMRDEWDR